jgi:hypothetical protein
MFRWPKRCSLIRTTILEFNFVSIDLKKSGKKLKVNEWNSSKRNQPQQLTARGNGKLGLFSV